MLVNIMKWEEYFSWYKRNILDITEAEEKERTRWNHASRCVEIIYPTPVTINDYNNAFKIWDKKYGNNRKKAVFLTLQDFKRRPEDLDKMKLFINNILYLFKEYCWIIESGKKEPLNLHCHILCIIENKNVKRAINVEYKKLFHSSIVENDYYHMKQWRNSEKMPPYDQWLQEKIDYFDNNLKGEHENLVDYTKTGGFGVSDGFSYFL